MTRVCPLCVLWSFAGVGFSYGDKADFSHNEEEVSEHLYRFLQVRRSTSRLVAFLSSMGS